MRKVTLSLLVLLLSAGAAWAQAPVLDPGWEAIVIREANDGVTGPPIIQDNDDYVTDAIEIAIVAGGQKAGLATDLMNGARVDQIETLHIDRLDDVASSGSLYGPYFNIWITDGLGNYAVIANEPSDGEWAGSRWDVPDWAFLSTKRVKVYETPDAAALTSWVHTHALANGWSGVATELRFEHVGDLVIAPPPAAYVQDPLNAVGTGAPDEYGTDIARGYTWVFGDSAANYLSGGDGFIVDNYSVSAPLAVQNVTKGTSYATIEAALADADAHDVIMIDDGFYSPPSTLSVGIPLTISGQSEAGVIIQIPAVGYGMSVGADDVTLENFTLACDAANENFPVHASGTNNKPDGWDNLTIRNVTISGDHRRTCFDIHGFNGVVLSGLTARDSWGGNGLQVTGVVGAVIDNITTSDNEWGSLAVYCSNDTYLNRPSSDITIDGPSCSFGEGVVFTQDEFGLTNFNVAVTGYGYLVRNYNFRADAAGFTYFQDTEANAIAWATVLDGVAPGSFITLIGGGTHIVVPGMGIKWAIEGASDGDTVEVAGGTYVENGQILVDKSVTVLGDAGDRPVVMTDASTGSSGDTRGWFLHTAGTLTMRNLVLDGAGYDIYQGIRSYAAGVLDNCSFSNIVFPGYGGVMVAAFGTGNWHIDGCTFDNIGRIGILAFGAGLDGSSFTNNTYTGKGVGDWLDYACDISAGAVMTVTGNTITECRGVASSDGSTSAALLVTTLYGAGTTAVIDGNVLTGNSTGVAIGYDAADLSVVSGTGNDLSGNDSYGVSNTAANTVDFLGNWWGAASGPYHATQNPAGTGVPVGDNILFDPWTGMAGGDIVPVTTGPLNCTQSVTLTFSFTADDYTPDVFLYNAVVSATAGLDFGAVEDLEPFGDINNNFFAMETGANQWTITGSTVGSPTYPVSGAGTTDLFSIVFSATGDVIGDVVFDSLTLRDPDNNTIPVTLEGATIAYDCTAPAAVTAITAAPGHNKVAVGWNHDGPDVDHFMIYRGVWYDTTPGVTAYPEYDDLVGSAVPVRPVAGLPDPGQGWVRVDGDAVDFPAESFFDVFVDFEPLDPPRGVYYYEVYAVDEAGNISPPAAANDRATNYWLGDVDQAPGGSTPDGEVDPFDMNVLGTYFGTAIATNDPGCEVDVGPTDDWSRLGIPTTDSFINFEDLMVFAMNFGVVAGAKSTAPVGKTVDLAWVDYEDGTMALRLTGGENLKGLRIVADVPVHGVTAGVLLDEQSELTFLKNVGNKLDASVAVMGVNNTFSGTGDLLIVDADAAIALDDLKITARGADNSTLELRLDQTSDTPTPRVFALGDNYPNPFNPQTKIAFSLPEAHHVRLAIYSVDGTKVATLVDEARSAGLHEILWTGRDEGGRSVASGTYFYRIEAGPYSNVKKMTLMK